MYYQPKLCISFRQIVLIGLLLLSAIIATSATAQARPNEQLIPQPGGSCGIGGQGRITVVNETNGIRFIRLHRQGRSAIETTLGPGKSIARPICNGKRARVQVYSAPDCGKTYLGESRLVRVINIETLRIRNERFTYDTADPLRILSAVAGFALTAVAEGHGIPPQVLEDLGVQEAAVVSACGDIGDILDGAQCIYTAYEWLPQPWQQTIDSDTCLTNLYEQGRTGTIFVNSRYAHDSIGTVEAPFQTIQAAYELARSDSTTTLQITAGNYPEVFEMSKPLTLVAVDGTVTIGR